MLDGVARQLEFPHNQSKTLRMAILAAMVMLGADANVRAVHPRQWKFNSEASYARGHFRGTVVNNYGQLALGRRLKPLLAHSDFRFVNTVLAARDGTAYFGTSPRGKVYRIRHGKITVFYAPPATETRVLALAMDRRGRLLASLAGSRGELVRLTAAAGKVRAKPLFAAPSVRYIWAIRALADGAIILATGPHGEIWKVPPRGPAKLLLETGAHNVMNLAVTKGGQVLACTDDPGLVIRLNPRTGASFVLLSTGHAEIASLALDPAGDIYAATASPDLARLAGGVFQPQVRPNGRPASVGSAVRVPVKPPAGKPSHKPAHKAILAVPTPSPITPACAPATLPAPAGTLPAPPAAGPAPPGNAVYEISANGQTVTLLHVPDMVLAMRYYHHQLMLGTGDHGRLIFYNPFTQTESLVARLKQSDILSLAVSPHGRVYLGTANQGQVYQLSRQTRPTGRYLSAVQDANLPSDWGAAHVRANLPHGASVTIQTRSGNTASVRLARRFWSDWSAPIPANTYRRISSPAARYLQFRLNLKSSPAGLSPVVRSTVISWQQINVPPRITSAWVHFLATHPHHAVLRWTAHDPDGDTLQASLQYRQKGVPVWIHLARHIHAHHYDWNTRQLPDGRYRVKIIVSDAPDNTPQTTYAVARETRWFLVENTPPQIQHLRWKALGRGGVRITGIANDTLSPIVAVEVQVDSDWRWRPARASDNMFDAPLEAFSARLEKLASGPHRIAIRARDAKGNTAYASVLVTVP